MIRLELDTVYFSKGATFRQENVYQQDPPASERVRKEFALQGFAVPVLAKVRVLPRPYPYIIAGLDFSFFTAHMLHEFRMVEPFDPDFRLQQDVQLIHETRTFDWGPVLGIGFAIDLPMTILELELRYQAGIPDISLEPSGYKVRTRSLFVVAGFRI